MSRFLTVDLRLDFLDLHRIGSRRGLQMIDADSFHVRLSGGHDSCSGRVEVYSDGQWGTLCDSSWFLDDSVMLCKNLGCGPFVDMTQYEHTLGTYMAFICMANATSLRNCSMHRENPIICGQSRAVGLVCKDSSVVTGFMPISSTGVPLYIDSSVVTRFMPISRTGFLALLLIISDQIIKTPLNLSTQLNKSLFMSFIIFFIGTEPKSLPPA
ncbi:T-cell differentiation antigen CD6-like [Discoglossus pictus]